MTLRFFGRKSSAKAAKEGAVPPDEKPASEKERPPRRSRTSARSADGSADGATRTPARKRSTASTSAASSRGGRSRRGGAGRRASTTPPTEAAEKRPPVSAPSPAQGNTATSLEALLIRQSEVTEQQLAVLKGLQGSLSAIENRLSGLSGGTGVAERPRVGIFVDVPNVMYAAERLRVKLDYGKLMEFLSRDRELVRASAYAPISDDPNANLDTQKFVEPFMGLGYRIVTKPLKRYADGSVKANFDVELAIDVLTMSDRLDIVVLVSGDSDFRRLVELVESKGVRVEVVSFGESVSTELRAVADEYIELNEHLKELRVSS